MKNKKLYVVGYVGGAQSAIYSNNAWAFGGEGGISKMTLPAAKKHLKKLVSTRCSVAIFKLVPILKIKKNAPTK